MKYKREDLYQVIYTINGERNLNIMQPSISLSQMLSKIAPIIDTIDASSIHINLTSPTTKINIPYILPVSQIPRSAGDYIHFSTLNDVLVNEDICRIEEVKPLGEVFPYIPTKLKFKELCDYERSLQAVNDITKETDSLKVSLKAQTDEVFYADYKSYLSKQPESQNNTEDNFTQNNNTKNTDSEQ